MKINWKKRWPYIIAGLALLLFFVQTWLLREFFPTSLPSDSPLPLPVGTSENSNTIAPTATPSASVTPNLFPPSQN